MAFRLGLVYYTLTGSANQPDFTILKHSPFSL